MTDSLLNAKVLIVDDEILSRQIVAKTLNSIGIENISSVTNGLEALEVIKSQTHNIIICDLNMPEMDGIEFLRHLAITDYSGDIILISSQDKRMIESVGNLASAHSLNVLGTLRKPILAKNLKEMLSIKNSPNRKATTNAVDVITPVELKNGIENQELVNFYQPKINVATKKIIGVESLVRWKKNDGTVISPDKFIPVAEKFDLIDDLTKYIMKLAIKDCLGWNISGQDFSLSVNVSTLNLKALDFPSYVNSLIQEFNFETKNLVLEVTETQLMEDTLTPLEILTRLRLKGIKLSIDDFGTGYSSMEQLKSIPFTEMKIDRAFVNGASKNEAAHAILEASVSLAKSLEMSIVAEGVETKEDWNLIEKMSIDIVQGYYIAKPMPAHEFKEWMDCWNAK